MLFRSVSTGERRAIGTRNGLVFEGAWVWRWKDWIDRRFMRKFAFPPIPPEEASSDGIAPQNDKAAVLAQDSALDRAPARKSD